MEDPDKALGKLEQIGHTYSLSATADENQGSPLDVGDNAAAIFAKPG
jgi:hypothetical protein